MNMIISIRELYSYNSPFWDVDRLPEVRYAINNGNVTGMYGSRYTFTIWERVLTCNMDLRGQLNICTEYHR